MDSICFLYNNKQYFIDFKLFKKHSKYISKLYPGNLENKTIRLNLISEYDFSSRHSEKSIESFFLYCNNEKIKITDSNVISLFMLSKRYEVLSLIRKSKKYIKEHYETIIDDDLSKEKDSNGAYQISHVVENLISNHFTDYLTDDRLFYIPASNLYRIFAKYFKLLGYKNIPYEIQDDDIEIQLIDFLYKYINKNGQATSFLISLFKFGKKGSLYLQDLLTENSANFEFEFLKNTIFRSLHFLNNKEEIKNEIREEIRQEYDKRQKTSIEIIRTNCIEIFNEFLQIEFFKDKFVEERKQNEDHFIALLKYGFLYTIRSIFNGVIVPENHIKNEVTSLRSDDKVSISKFDILNGLLKNQLFSFTPSIIVGNKTFSEAISIISMIQSTQEKKSLKQLFKLIERKNDLIEFIEKVFPFHYFKNSEALSLLSLWIPVMKSLIQNDISLSIQFDEEFFLLHKSTAEHAPSSSSNTELKVYLVMNNPDNLTLCSKSRVTYGKKSYQLQPDNDILNFHFLNELSEKKMKSRKSIKSDKIFNYYLSNAKKKLNTKNPFESKIASLRDLIDIENTNSNSPSNVIGLIWNLVFTLSDIELFELAMIINPVESRMLKSVAKIFKSNSLEVCENMLQWCQWAQSIDSHIDIINSCILESNDLSDGMDLSKINSLIAQIEEAIVYLSKSTKIKNNFLDTDEILNACEREHRKLTIIKSKQNDIQNKFIELIEYLNGQKTTDKYSEMKRDLVEEMKKIQSFSNKIYLNIKSIIDKFLIVALNNEDERNDDDLIWPFEGTIDSNIEIPEKVKVLDVLIWYFNIESILKKIESNTNLFENLNKLSQFEEMKNIRKIILSHLIYKESIETDLKDGLYTLQAYTIYKLSKINELFITNPNHITKIVNDYANRGMCTKSEIEWIQRKMKENSSDFLIRMPIFVPNSLIYLIIKIDGYDNKYTEGPLFAEIPDIDLSFLFKEIDIAHQEFSTFSEVAKSIGQIFYTSIISENEVPPEKIENLRQAFQDNTNEEYSNLTTRIETLFFLADSIDNWPASQFNFDDMFFTSMDYDELLLDESILNSYPSFLYWIIENEAFMKELINKYKDVIFHSKKVPLWVICLRILSSQNCIKFESNSKTQFYEIINKVTTNQILNFLNDDSKPNNYIWLNILRSNLPFHLSDPLIQMFHKYLHSLSLDGYESDNKRIKNIKRRYINDSTLELTHMLLTGKAQTIMKSKLNKSLICIDFLTEPSKLIQYYIKDILKKKSSDEKIFDFNYNLFDLSKIKQVEPTKTNITLIENKEVLTSPVIFISDQNEITCSLKKISCRIGPIFPSLKSSQQIKINFISHIEKSVNVSIKNIENSQYLELAKHEFKNREPIEVFIKTPKIGMNDSQFIQIKGKINFELGNSKKLSIPLNIDLLLLPIQVKIKCDQYLLTEIDNNQFRLCCDHLYSNDQIDFEIDIFNLNDIFIQNVDIELLDENDISPLIVEIDKKKRTFSIKMPKVTEFHKCKMNAAIKFTDKFEAKIQFDLILRPYIFTFEMYDYCTKSFAPEIGRIFMMNSSKVQILHFRIKCLHPFNKKRKCKLFIDIPYFITVISYDLKNLVEFEIEDKYTFYIIIKSSNMRLEALEKSYGISVRIGDMTQRIKFSFIDTINDTFYPCIREKEKLNNDYLNDFPCYFYSNIKKEWVKLEEYKDLINKTPEYPFVTVTPFKSQTDLNKFLIVQYIDGYVTTNSSSNVVKYLQVSIESDEFKTSNSSAVTTEKRYEKKILFVNKEVSINFYSIIGFDENNKDLWFPVFTEYPEMNDKGILSYSEESIEKAKKEFNDKIESNHSSSLRPTDSIILYHYLYKKSTISKKDLIIEFIDQFPDEVKNEINYELNYKPTVDKIISGEFNDDMFIVITYNLLISIIFLFKEKYKTIESHSYCLQMNVSDGNVQKQIDVAYNKLTEYDNSFADQVTSDMKELFEKHTNEMMKIKIENLPPEENQFECMLLVENNHNKHCNWDDPFGEISFDLDSFNFNSVLKCIIENSIDFPEIKIPEDLTIENYKSYFVTCSRGAILLPSLVIKALESDFEISLAEVYLSIILVVFKAVSKEMNNNKSFMADYINDFIELFRSCANRLKLAGAVFDEIEIKNKEKEFYSLISIPKYSFFE